MRSWPSRITSQIRVHEQMCSQLPKACSMILVCQTLPQLVIFVSLNAIIRHIDGYLAFHVIECLCLYLWWCGGFNYDVTEFAAQSEAVVANGAYRCWQSEFLQIGAIVECGITYFHYAIRSAEALQGMCAAERPVPIRRNCLLALYYCI